MHSHIYKMLRRPKPGDTEEDLLKFQEKFMGNQEKPAVTVLRQKTEPDLKRDGGSESYPTDDIEENDVSTAAVLTKIIERDTQASRVHLPRQTHQAFPSVLSCGQTHQAVSSDAIRGRKKKSLFAQQFSARGAGHFGVMLRQEVERAATVTSPGVSMEMDTMGDECPRLVQGVGLSATFGKDEAIQIHQENLAKMAAMSDAEIVQEQQKLVDMLDPKLLSFIKSKRDTEAPSSFISAPAMAESRRKESSMEYIGEDEMPIKPSKDWVNMDKAEYEKLAWMRELPPPKTGDKPTGQQARFDFKGELVHADLDLLVDSGLHHHGNEPERAGYTMEELFLLARSTNVQQRVIALNTMARIFYKARRGEFSMLVQSAVLPAVLNGGGVFLLRWAMDDTIDMVMTAAVWALHNLIVNPADELALDQVFSWHLGHVVPATDPCQGAGTSKVNKGRGAGTSKVTEDDDDDNTPQETDADVLKRDVVLCLVERMNLLPRIRYILGTWRPQAPTVLHLVGILTRIARHSTKMAYKVVQCPGLIELILHEFLPTCWQEREDASAMSDLYGTPVPVVLRLMRTLTQAGRHIAAHLISTHHVQTRLLRFLVDDHPRHLEFTESYQLQIESLRLLKVCLLYGLGAETFIDLFPVFVRKLQELQHDVVDESVSDHKTEMYVELIGALEGAVHLAGTASGSSGKAVFSRSEDCMSLETRRSEVIAVPTINWGHVADLLQPVVSVLKEHLTEVKDTYQIKKQNLQLAVACINLVSSYYTRWQAQVSVSAVVSLQSVEDYVTTVLEPCWSGFGFQVIFSSLSEHSQLLSCPPVEENTPSVADLGCIGENRHPILSEGTPYGLVTAILRQIYTLCGVHKGIRAKVLPWILDHRDLWSYLRKVSVSESHLHANHFTKFENLVHYYSLKLACLSDEIPLAHSVVQKLTLTLMTRLHYGSEYLIHDLLSTVLFDPRLWRTESQDVAGGVMASLSDSPHVSSVSKEQVCLTPRELLQGCHAQLPTLRSTYLNAFSHSEMEAHISRHCFTMTPLETESFFTSRPGECLMPRDWMYVPLIDLYNVFCSVGADVQSALSISQVDTVTSVLQWIYLLEACQRDNMAAIPVTLKVSRLMCVFLTGNDLFLDKTVHCYLAALLRLYTMPTLLQKMDFEKDIPGLVSFYDLFVALLQQYEAVSFSDPLFGCYVLLPLQQKHNIQLRRAVWVEYRGILRTLHLPLTELLVPVEGFLTPEETDTELLRLYLEALLSGSVQGRWCPVLYLIAIHHVNRFCYTQDGKNTQLKHGMLQIIVECHTQEVRHHLLYYKAADIFRTYGMELYDTLPPLRQKLVQEIERDFT